MVELVSVVVPTYGRPDFLPDAVRSVVDQTYAPIELIVVDDCSPDPIEPVVDEIDTTGLRRTEVIRHRQNRGANAARNTGIEAATGDVIAFLDANPAVAVACGRRRERHPEASVYNRLIDAEWDTPVGRARSCGGDALMRAAALQEVGGFDPGLIAGEEPELCVRLRAKGWEVWRLDAEMTLHDAALTRFGQWWQRTRRGGHAFAEGAALHGAPPERHCVPELRRLILWGVALPLATVLGAVITPWALLLLLAWPAQMLRLRLRGLPWDRAVFLTLSKLPEAQGALTYLASRIMRTRAGLIEYK